MTKQEYREQYKALTTEELQWVRHGDGEKAEASGFTLYVANVVENDKPTKKWSWMLSKGGKLLGKEVASSEGGAKRSASRAARKAQQAKLAAVVAAAPAPAPAKKPTAPITGETVLAGARAAAKPPAAKKGADVAKAIADQGEAFAAALAKPVGPAPAVNAASTIPAAKKPAARKAPAKKAA